MLFRRVTLRIGDMPQFVKLEVRLRKGYISMRYVRTECPHA